MVKMLNTNGRIIIFVLHPVVKIKYCAQIILIKKLHLKIDLIYIKIILNPGQHLNIKTL